MRKIVLSVFTILLLAFQVSAQNQRVSGTVTDQSGETQIGVTVQLKGTNVAVATNVDGQYSINAPANGVLVFSYLGMKTQELNVGGRTVINVVMEVDAQDAGTVTIIGYGSGTALGNTVGSHTSVGGQSLTSRPTPNVADALQGKVAGMQSWISSGEPTATASIRIRGISSVTQSSEPLYILDGVPVTANIFNQLNAYDIENITILKDAASTAIYGSRAANGVIYISSKKGKKGLPPRLTINAQYGVAFNTTSKLDMMNASELVEFEEMVFPDLKDSESYQLLKKEVTEYGLDYDWEKYAFLPMAPAVNINAEVSGGGENNRYLFSFGYYSKEGTSIRSDMERFNFRINTDVDFSKKFRVGASAALSYLWREEATTGWYVNSPSSLKYTMQPYRMPYEYEIINKEVVMGKRMNDQQSWGGWYDLYYYTDMTSPRSRTTVSLNGNLYEELRPIEGLTIKAVQAMDAFDYTLNSISSPLFPLSTGNGSVQRSFQRVYNMSATNTIDYKHTFGEKHNLSLLLGHESNIYKSDQFGIMVSRMVYDKIMTLTSGNSETSSPSSSFSEYVFNAFFFQADYNYDNKYFISGTVRRDGSSRFGKDNQWGTFYSAAGMWDIKKENFLIDVDAINMLRLRANYGETGNADLGNYQWRDAMALGQSLRYGEPYGMAVTRRENPDLSWETIAQLNLGITARFFDRVNLTFDWYNRATLDMLISVPETASTGFSSGYKNVGSLRNRGIELDVNFDIISNANVYWGINANASYNKNTITKLYGDVSEYTLGDTGLILKVGESLGAYRVVRRAGVDPYDGQLIWYDKDGNLTKIWDPENEVLNGMNMYADWTGGFGTTFSWKNLTFSMDFIWCGPKYAILNEYLYTRSLQFGQGQSNYETWMNGIWLEPWQVTDVPGKDTPFQFDSSVHENAAFLRLKNASISYTLPKSWMSRTGGVLQNAKIYITGRNLLTFTNFPGIDPEIDTNVSQFRYPNSREVLLGLELTF